MLEFVSHDSKIRMGFLPVSDFWEPATTVLVSEHS